MIKTHWGSLAATRTERDGGMLVARAPPSTRPSTRDDEATAPGAHIRARAVRREPWAEPSTGHSWRLSTRLPARSPAIDVSM